MRKIALTGPIGSGKTTLARALQQRGYTLINFTDVLKHVLCNVVQDYVELTPQDIHNQKEKYRALLQEFGTHIGFSTNPRFIHLAILAAQWDGESPAVFDNVRTVEQASYLRSVYGFEIVRLDAPNSSMHPIEQGIPEHLIDAYIQSKRPLAQILQEVTSDVMYTLS